MKQLIFILVFLLSPVLVVGQDYDYPDIKRDTTFKPYVHFDKESGNYVIGYMRDAETGKVYETLYVPPTKIKPIFNAKTTKEGNLYTYNYKLINSKESRQDISSFEFEIKGAIRKIDLPEPWFRMGNSFMHRVLEKVEYNENEPIEFKSDLQIGDTLNFRFRSSYPPAIINSYVTGTPKRLDFSYVLPPTRKVRILADSLRKIDSDRGVKLKTISLQAPSSPFDELSFFNKRINVLSEVIELKWINDEEFIRELRNQLSLTRKFLLKNERDKASQSLQWIVKMVNKEYRDQDHEKDLTSEGYSLFYYNAEYLLERLKKDE